MTLWSPDYRIKANGTDVTGISLVGFTITKGRTDINSVIPPGYCRLDLINFDNTDYPFTVNTAITVEVKKSDNTYVFLFGGRISDISTQVQSAGSGGNFTSISITAVGLLSRLSRTIYTGNLSEDLDGAQIFAMLETSLGGTWNTVPTAETWASYDPTQTWDDLFTALGQIDTGLYTMRSQTLSGAYISTVVNDIAQSAGGYLYEDNQGRICYADADHRANELIANGYTELDARQAFSAGIASITRQGDLVNKFTINHGNNFQNAHTVEDLESQANFGIYAQSVNSYLKNTPDVEDFAARIVDLRSFPFSRLASITYPIQSPEIGDTSRDILLSLTNSLPLRITNLPDNIEAGQFSGFVEGWTYRSTVNGLSVTLNLSPTAFSAISQRWQQVNAAETWNTINSGLEWEYAIGVIS